MFQEEVRQYITLSPFCPTPYLAIIHDISLCRGDGKHFGGDKTC